MQIRYDKQAKVAGIGVLPWPRLGLEQWFDSYTIASRYGWGATDLEDAPPLVSLANTATPPTLPKLNTPSLLANETFQQMLIDTLAGYHVLTYRPVRPPQVLTDAGCHFLGVDPAISAQLENKAGVRELLADEHLPFPKYRIVDRSSITVSSKGLAELLQGSSAVMLQDEKMSGGQGTFLVRDLAELTAAHQYFEGHSKSTRVVVSEYIADAYDRTAQACVTRYGVFVGPLQKQIIGNSLLTNMNVPGAARYSGGEVSAHDPCGGAQDEVITITKRIGKRMQATGYRGVFGVDFLIDRQGRVHLIEINPRLTGITPLLTMRYRAGHDIPFLLLHVLELADLDYTITDDYIDSTPAEGGIFVLHSWLDRPSRLTSGPEPGLYSMEHRKRLKPHVHFDSTDPRPQLLVQPATFGPEFTVHPGARMSVMMTNTTVLDEHDHLTPVATDTIEWLREQTILNEI